MYGADRIISKSEHTTIDLDEITKRFERLNFNNQPSKRLAYTEQMQTSELGQRAQYARA